MIPDPKADVRVGWPVLLAADMHLSSPETLSPSPDPRLAPDWILHGYVTGVDAILRSEAALELSGGRVCYGVLLESTAASGSFVLAIRGTADAIEWFIDAEFSMTPHPRGGEAETGFYDLYGTLAYLAASDDAEEEPLITAVMRVVGTGTVTVAGHSLGSALATYLTLDLAETPSMKVRGRYFASPRPGNAAFADMFDKTVADYVSYAYSLDAVPHVPLGLGYSPLHNLAEWKPDSCEARIAFGLGAAHHLVCYLAEMDYAFKNWSAMPPVDKPNAACIKGPNGN